MLTNRVGYCKLSLLHKRITYFSREEIWQSWWRWHFHTCSRFLNKYLVNLLFLVFLSCLILVQVYLQMQKLIWKKKYFTDIFTNYSSISATRLPKGKIFYLPFWLSETSNKPTRPRLCLNYNFLQPFIKFLL